MILRGLAMSTCTHSHNDELHHVHHGVDIAQRLAEMTLHCQQQGLRLTPLRLQVLDMILRADRPMGAYDLLAGLDRDGKRAAPPTAYRALDFLLEQGFIHRLASINAYIPCCHPREGHQAAFLICQKCQQVSETSAASLVQTLASIAAAGQFVPQHTLIEISGLCGRCCHA
jgi:Fur family zinc uptake transcriptional regulator